MKRLLLCLLMTSCGLACTRSNDPTATSTQWLTVTETDADTPPVYTLEVRQSFTDIPTNVHSFCTDNGAVCGRQLHERQLALMALNPVPVPQPNTALPVTVAEADKLYRQFVAAHQGEPMLALFQQYFPRILLNKYGVLTSRNYPLIAYYTQQLIDANSYDLVTQANALTILKPHLPAAQFNHLLQTATATARTFLPEHKRDVARSLAELANPGVDERLFPPEARERLKARYMAEEQALTQAIRQLEQMQRRSGT